MLFEQFKGFDAKYHLSCVNEFKFPEQLSLRELSTAICIDQEFLARIKCWAEFVIFIEYKDFSDMREVRRLLKTWTKAVTCRFAQQLGIKSREQITWN